MSGHGRSSRAVIGAVGVLSPAAVAALALATWHDAIAMPLALLLAVPAVLLGHWGWSRARRL